MHTLFQAHCLVRFDGPTLRYLYEMKKSVKDAFEQCFARTNALYVDIWKSLEMIQNNIIHPIYATATFLNPIYMHGEKFKEIEEMKNDVNHIRKHLVAEEEKEKISGTKNYIA